MQLNTSVMYSTLYIYIALTVICDVIYARPVYKLNPAHSKDELIFDPEGLKDLLAFCKSNDHACDRGSKLDKLARRLLHKSGFSRYETHGMMRVVRDCLSTPESCHIDLTIQMMIDLRALFELAANNNGNRQMARSNIIRNLYQPKLLSVLMSVRGHRNQRRAAETNLLRQKRAIAARAKRSIWTMYFTTLKSACSHGSCLPDHDNSNTDDTPDTAEF